TIIVNHQPNSIIIQSRQNPKIKHIAKLAQRTHRERSGQFVIEGLLELNRAIENRIPIEEIFYCQECVPSKAEYRHLLKKATECGISIQAVTQPVFQKI